MTEKGNRKATRKTPTIADEAAVLLRSARRCAFCYGLSGDTQEKKGQVAHVDHDPSNSLFENLVFLCLDHHDQYDSGTSQAKGLTRVEAQRYREMVHEYVDQLRRAGGPLSEAPAGRRSHTKPLPVSQFAYERRLSVYKAATKFLGKVYRDVTVEHQDLADYSTGIEEALFLFDEGTERYLRLLFEKAVRLRFLHGRMSGTKQIPPDERSRLSEEEAELLKWFIDQLSELRRRLHPFLQVR